MPGRTDAKIYRLDYRKAKIDKKNSLELLK
jgi:hypothetical protein